jgi:hypothetical protein
VRSCGPTQALPDNERDEFAEQNPRAPHPAHRLVAVNETLENPTKVGFAGL